MFAHVSGTEAPLNSRDLAVVAYRTLALWFLATGTASFVGQWVTWKQTAATLEEEWVWVALAQAGLLIPVGAVIWLLAPSLAKSSFPPSTAVAPAPSLKSVGSIVTLAVGLALLAKAIPQLLYWLVVWRAARGTEYWSLTGNWRGSEDSVVYSVSFKAQLASTMTELGLGLLCLIGGERLSQSIGKLRREFRSRLTDSDSEPGAAP